MRISSFERARIAGLLGEIAWAVDQLPDFDPAPPPSPPPKFGLTVKRIMALTGLSLDGLKAIAVLSDEEFSQYLRDRDDPPSDPAPELPLGPPVVQPLSSITPSKGAARVGKFSQLVSEITSAAE